MRRIRSRVFAIAIVCCLALSGMTLALSEPYSDSNTIMLVQQKLNELGGSFECGTQDGIMGSATLMAIINYQNTYGLTATGTITDELLTALRIPIPDGAAASGAAISGEPYTDSGIIMLVQQKLNELGGYFECGTPDGKIGGATYMGIVNYQSGYGLKVTGTVTDELLSRLGIDISALESSAAAASEPEEAAPATEPAVEAASDAAASEASYTDSATVTLVQQKLNELGGVYDCGAPDGKIGSATSTAITNYQSAFGLKVTGTVTDELLNALRIPIPAASISEESASEADPAVEAEMPMEEAETVEEPASAAEAAPAEAIVAVEEEDTEEETVPPANAIVAVEEEDAEEEAAPSEAALGEPYTDSNTVWLVQQRLNEVGGDFACGVPDGKIGARTAEAITRYQSTYGLEVTGTITDELLTALVIAIPNAEEEPEVTAIFSNTKAFTAKLDSEDFLYTLRGLDSDGDERLTLTIEGSDVPYHFIYFFNSDMQHTNIRVWYLIEFADEYLVDVVRACNELNYNYNYARFYVDEIDNSVTVSMDLIYREEDAGDVVWEATRRMTNVINEAYPRLSPYRAVS